MKCSTKSRPAHQGEAGETSEPYILALKDEHAAKVNRAAKALLRSRITTPFRP